MLYEVITIDPVGQFDQWIRRVTYNIQPDLEKLVLRLIFRFLWSHSFARK